jgi:hypothetical protein
MEDAETGRGVVLNSPAEGLPGRAVGSSLAVFAQRPR